MKPLSFSAVDAFQNCERRYYYDRIQRLPGTGDTHALTVGLTYHAAIASAFLGGDELIHDACVDAIKDQQRDLALLSIDTEQLRSEMVARIRDLFYAFDFRLKPARGSNGELLIEQRFNNEELGYTGVIDLIAAETPISGEEGIQWVEEPCVLDFKVVTSDKRRSERDTWFSPQLALYALHTQVNRAGFIEIPRNRDKPIRFHTVSYTPQELARWRAWLANMAATVRSRGTEKDAYRLTHRSNGLCSPRWCPRWDLCYGEAANERTGAQAVG